jgi:sugar lactone lactonase YvrE
MADTRVLLDGLGIGESARWHDGRLWLSNWLTQDVIAVGPDGRGEVMATIPTTIPFSIDWLPDGPLVATSGPEGLVLRQEADGSLVTHADLSTMTGMGGMLNEIVVDGRGRIYVNSPTGVALIPPAGPPRQVADGLAFGNGMAVTADGATLIVAESHGGQLTAFAIEADGSLSPGRPWARLEDGHPDGICIDAEGAVWYADVPGRRCVRVREGGEVLQTVAADRGCFACMLGGPDGRTLFMLAAEWHGFDRIWDKPDTGQVLTARAPAPHAGRP